MVSILSLISSSSRLLGIIQSIPTITGITLTLINHNFFSSWARSKYLSSFPHSFSFTLWSPEQQNPQDSKFSFFSFFWLINTRSDLLAEIRWSDCISKSHRISWVSFIKADSGLYIYHLIVWSNFHLLHNSQWITFSTQSCLLKLLSFIYQPTPSETPLT